MWGNKKSKCKESEFFKGTNIFEKLSTSTFGKVKRMLSEIFTEDDIKEYTLPKVIVIGNESTGKSSLLENITKCQIFPRNQKICTKCPIHFRLANGASKYIISYSKNNPCEKETIELRNKNEIYEIINEYMKNMPADYISDLEITVDITDQDVPTIDMYDIPGLRSYPADAAEITTNLCKKYLCDKNSIVLCVVPAVIPRLTSCQSIALIREMGMEQNCIMALTMSDKLQSDDIEELLIKRIIKTSDELDGLNFAGYVAVVNRLHSDMYSLEENDTNEIKWFNENILSCIPDEYTKYSECIRDNIMISNLLTKMDVLYNEFIHRDWKPRMMRMIEVKINNLKSKYAKLGSVDVCPDELNSVICSFIDAIYHDIRESCKKPIASFVELFENDDEENEETEKNKSEKDDYRDIEQCETEYYNNMKTIDTDMRSYASFDVSHIKNMIDRNFKNEKKYKLERFLNVKNDLIQRIENDFNTLTKENLTKIKDSVERYSIMKYLDDDVTTVHHNKIFELYRLLVLYPLLSIEISYDVNDYVESKEYKQRRNILLESIAILEKHYDSIKTLAIS